MPFATPKLTGILIYQALSFLTNELSDYLATVVPDSEPRAVLAAHVNPDGTPTTIADKVSLTLLNLTPETTVRNLLPERSSNGSDHARLSPSIKLNLHVLVAANFKEYAEALKFLGLALAFFQGHSVFTPQSSPRLDRSFDRLVVELEAASYQEWSHVWGMLGSKQLPSVVYKVKLVTIQDGLVQGRTPAVSGLGVNK